MLTTNPEDPRICCGGEDKYPTKQCDVYLVLPEEERAKGFIRPVRRTYIHTGQKIERDEEGRIIGRLIKIDDSEYDDRDGFYSKGRGFGGYIKYPKSKYPLVGKYLLQKEVDAIIARKTHFGGCGIATTMGIELSETYARNPKFYGLTYCCGCQKHLPIEQFVWDGTNETVGS